MTNVPLDIRSGYSRADMNHPDFPAARHALDLEVRASGPPMPTDAEAALFDLFVKDWHREDSRPGSWCMRIGSIGKRAVYHLEYNPHGDADWRTVFGPGGWVEDAKGNADALLKIAIHAGSRSGADAGVSSKQPKRVSATTPADHEPDTSQQPLFPSAAVAAEIVAQLDERAEAASEDDDRDPFGDDDNGDDGSRDYDDDPEARDEWEREAAQRRSETQRDCQGWSGSMTGRGPQQ